MFCDLFNKADARKLLRGKRIWFFGSSNMRAIYKDVIWLLEKGSLAPQDVFRTKNEEFYLKDARLSNGALHNGVNYKETREYKSDCYIFFHFLTRLYLDDFVKMIEETVDSEHPDILLINSTLWDLTRWGSTADCIQQFKMNLVKTLKCLRLKFPGTRIIWKSALPVSPTATGAIFVDEVRSVVPMLPWHIIEANSYAATSATFFNVDLLDVHHHLRLTGYLRVKDGIHWDSLAVRYLTNLLLTHVALGWGAALPGVFVPSDQYLRDTSAAPLPRAQVLHRIDKKKSFFDKFLERARQSLRPLKIRRNATCINKAKDILKRKKRNIVNKVKKMFNGGRKNLFKENFFHNQNVNVYNNFTTQYYNTGARRPANYCEEGTRSAYGEGHNYHTGPYFDSGHATSYRSHFY